MKRIGMIKSALSSATLAALAGCTMAPHYTRPSAPVPATFVNGATGAAAESGSQAAMPDWQTQFLDPKLRQVISLALDNNRDLRVAMLNIDKARAQYRIQRSDLLPSIDASGGLDRERVSRNDSNDGHSEVTKDYTAQVGLSSWELDLFGRIRSLKKEALENWLATAQTQRDVRMSLVGEVASDWLAVAANQQLLALAQQTLASQQQSLQRIQAQHDRGLVSGVDVAQAQTSVETARADAASDATQLAQARDALQLVVGAPVPNTLMPGPDALAQGVALAAVPAQLSSQVLLQRPDVLSAEHSLQAANADIGAARAAFFPTVSLTASTGRSSDELSSLFSAGTRTWSFIPTISLPIFHAGALKASLDVSKISKDIAVAQYEKAIQSAFAEVADALAARDHLAEQLQAEQALVEANQRAYNLAQARYNSGMDDHLAVLDAQRSLYSAQQDLITLQQQEASNRVTLYEVLGGGADAQPQRDTAQATAPQASAAR